MPRVESNEIPFNPINEDKDIKELHPHPAIKRIVEDLVYFESPSSLRVRHRGFKNLKPLFIGVVGLLLLGLVIKGISSSLSVNDAPQEGYPRYASGSGSGTTVALTVDKHPVVAENVHNDIPVKLSPVKTRKRHVQNKRRHLREDKTIIPKGKNMSDKRRGRPAIKPKTRHWKKKETRRHGQDGVILVPPGRRILPWDRYERKRNIPRKKDDRDIEDIVRRYVPQPNAHVNKRSHSYYRYIPKSRVRKPSTRYYGFYRYLPKQGNHNKYPRFRKNALRRYRAERNRIYKRHEAIRNNAYKRLYSRRSM